MEKNNLNLVLITVFTTVLLLGLGAFGFWFLQTRMMPADKTLPLPSQPQASTVPIPNPSPEVKPSVLPEPVEEQSEVDLIKQAFADKYDKQPEEVNLTIKETTGIYAQGGVSFAGEMGGGWFLAFNDKGKWIVVADGNGTVMCDDIKPYDFPVSMAPECWDEASMTLIKR